MSEFAKFGTGASKISTAQPKYNVSHKEHLTFSSSHLKNSKERGEINFNNTRYLAQHIRNTVILHVVNI